MQWSAIGFRGGRHIFSPQLKEAEGGIEGQTTTYFPALPLNR